MNGRFRLDQGEPAEAPVGPRGQTECMSGVFLISNSYNPFPKCWLCLGARRLVRSLTQKTEQTGDPADSLAMGEGWMCRCQHDWQRPRAPPSCLELQSAGTANLGLEDI